MESEISTSINSLEISDEIKLGIEEINSLLKGESLENNLIDIVHILNKINKLKKIFKKDLLEKLKETYSTDIILVLKAAENLDINDELTKKINNEYSLNIALMLAARNGHKENIELLLNNKVNLKNSGNNILIINSIHSRNEENEEVLRIILEKLKEDSVIKEIIKEIQNLYTDSTTFYYTVPLLAAIGKNNKKILEQIIDFSKYLLEKIEQSNQVFEDRVFKKYFCRSMILKSAVETNNKEITELIIGFLRDLLKEGKLTNKKIFLDVLFEEDDDYNTPLLLAVKKNNKEIVKQIIDFLKDLSEKGKLLKDDIFEVLNKKDNSGYNFFSSSIKNTNKDVVELIIDFLKYLWEKKILLKDEILKILNVEEERSYLNPLFEITNNKEAVKPIMNFLKDLLEEEKLSEEEFLKILNKEIKVYSHNKQYSYNFSNCTPLGYAILNNNEEVVQQIIGLSKKNLSREKFLEILNTEIKYTSSDNSINPSTILMLAVQNDNNTEIKYISSGNSINPSTILMLAVQNDNEKIIKILFENGADPDITYKDGNTPLMLAVQNRNEKIINILFENGANPNIQNEEGYTALMLAIQKVQKVQKGNENIIKILLENEANPNIKNKEGYTALMLAVQNIKKNIINILLEKGADLNIQNEEGYTALTLAVQNGNKNNIVNILLENKANPNIQDKCGNTPIFYAKSSNNREITKLLKQYDADDIEYNLEKLILESFFGYSLNKKIGDSGLIQYNPTDEEKRVFQIIRLQNLFFMAQALSDNELLNFFKTKGITENEVKKNNLFSGDDTSDFQGKDCFRKFINFTDTKEEDRKEITLNKKLIEQHLKRIIPIILSEISNYQINRFQERLVPFIDKLKIKGFDGGNSVKYIIKSAISTLFDVSSTIDQKWNAKEFLKNNLESFKEFYKKVSEKKDDSITNGYLMLTSICSAESKDELIKALFSIVRYKMQLMYSKEEFKYETIFSKTQISIKNELETIEKLEGKQIKTILNLLKNKKLELEKNKEIFNELQKPGVDINKILEKYQEFSELKEFPENLQKDVLKLIISSQVECDEKIKILKKLLKVKQNNGIVTYRGIQQKTKQEELSKNLLTNHNSTFGRPEFGLWDQNILNGLYYKVSKNSSCIGSLISTSILSYHSYYFAGIRKYANDKNYVFPIYFVPKEDLEKIHRTDREGEVAMSNLPLDYRIFNIVSDKDGKISLDFSTIAESMCFKYNKTELIQFFEKFKTMFNKLILEEQQEITKNLTDEQQDQLKQLLIQLFVITKNLTTEQQDQLEQLLIQLFAKNEEEKVNLESKTFNKLLESFKTQPSSNLPLDYRIFNIVSDEYGKISLDFSTVAESMCFEYNKKELIQFFEKFKTNFDKLSEKQQDQLKQLLIQLFAITKNLPKNLTPEQQDQLKQLLIQLFAKNEKEKKEQEFIHLTKQQLEAIILLFNKICIDIEISNVVHTGKYNMPLWTDFLQNLQMERTLDLLQKETEQLKIEGEKLEEVKTQLEKVKTQLEGVETQSEEKNENKENQAFKLFEMDSELFDLVKNKKLQFNPFTDCFIKEKPAMTEKQSKVKQQSQKTFVIPDIHGNLECFLQDLINIGAIYVKKDLYICFQKDSKNHHINLNKPLYIKQSDYEKNYKKNSSNYVKLPLIVIKKEFLESNSKIVQVGDLVDRGENSTECLVLSSLLSKQLRQNYTTIIGNHELAKLHGLYDEKVYDDENDTQKQLIADMIKSENMLCMQHIPGSNNIYSHVPLFKKNISYFISKLFSVESSDKYKGDNTESCDNYGNFSQQYQEELFILSIVSKLLEKLEKDKTTLIDIKGILDAKIDGTEKNQIISEIAKELKLSKNKEENKEENKEKIEVLQKCLENLKSEIEQQKENSFDYILDVFVDTSNKLVKDFVTRFISNSKETEDKQEYHIRFLLNSIINSNHFTETQRNIAPVALQKNNKPKDISDLKGQTFGCIENVCGHDTYPYCKENQVRTYFDELGILFTDEFQNQEEKPHACYYKIKKQQNGKIIYNAHRTEQGITLEQIKTIPCSETYKITTKKESVESEKDGEFSCIQFSAPTSIQTNIKKENSIPNTISSKEKQISSKGKEDEKSIGQGM